MKPDWKDAPEGAKYLAMDGDGLWFWHATKPKWRARQLWWASSGRTWLAEAPSPDAAAKYTMEERLQ